MFHKAIGKVMFPILVVVFLVLSIQNTWQFIQDGLPGETLVYKCLALVVFEGGFIGWLSLTMHGAENVFRTMLAGAMTVITGAGVFTAAIFEMGKQMHGVGFKLDPQFLGWVPVVVLGAFVATGTAITLYMLASPEFFARISHMNRTGQEPPIGSRIEMSPTTSVQLAQVATPPQQLPAPEPAQRALPSASQTQPQSWRVKLANAIGGPAYSTQDTVPALPVSNSTALQDQEEESNSPLAEAPNNE